MQTDPTPRKSADEGGFDALGLSAPALKSLDAAGFRTPTPVQRDAIPPGLAGRDVIATAATGTGKTLAFVLPIVERLAGRRGTRALVLAPTRELTQQIADVVRTFGGPRGVRCVEIVGGAGMNEQLRGLHEKREVIVATPGRLIDHIASGAAQLGGIEILVLDEADRMLDMGFLPQIDRIVQRVPRERQTLLLSATMGAEVSKFAQRSVREPVRILTAPSGTVARKVTQRVFGVRQQRKTDLLMAILGEDEDTTLVFTRTKHRAEKLAKVLHREGLRVARIHGDRTQSQRERALSDFKSGAVRILVATDVAARGLDVEEIGHVICYDLSLVPEDHVHRIGRTARASASGRATSLCSPEETPLLHAIERFTRQEIERAPLPEAFREMIRAESPADAQRGGQIPRGKPDRAAQGDARRTTHGGPRRGAGRPGGHDDARRTRAPQGPAGGPSGGTGQGPRPWRRPRPDGRFNPRRRRDP